jgi:hypothetical protein
MSRFNLYGVLLTQIIWFIVMTVGNNYIFNTKRNYDAYLTIPIASHNFNLPNLSVVSMLTILFPALFNIAVLSYWFMINDSNVDEYVENTVSKSMYIGYFPLVVTGFLVKGLITN